MLDFMAYDFVNATNDDPEDFVYVIGENRFTLRSGVPTVIPFDHMCRIAGYPWTRDEHERKMEVSRIRSRYGVGSLNPHGALPNLSFTDQDGALIPTPLSDPEGKGGIINPDSNDLSDKATILSAIEKMKGQINQLTQRLSQTENAEAAEAASDAKPDRPTPRVAKPPAPKTDIRTDSPKTVPTS